MYKNSIKNMPQKVCIRNFHRIFKMGENINEKVSKAPKNVELVHTRGHTNLELCNCRFKFSWISVGL